MKYVRRTFSEYVYLKTGRVNSSKTVYKITNIAKRVLIGYKPMAYCAGKLIENLKLFYKNNRPHFLWVYRRDNPLGMLGEHSKNL